MLLVVTEISNATRIVPRQPFLLRRIPRSLLKVRGFSAPDDPRAAHTIRNMEHLLQYLFCAKYSFYTDFELESGIPRSSGPYW
jgi:hypothetical protein